MGNQHEWLKGNCVGIFFFLGEGEMTSDYAGSIFFKKIFFSAISCVCVWAGTLLFVFDISQRNNE